MRILDRSVTPSIELVYEDVNDDERGIYQMRYHLAFKGESRAKSGQSNGGTRKQI